MNIVIRERDKQVLYLAIFVIIIVADIFMILGWQTRLLFGYFKVANEKKKAIVTLKNDIINFEGYKKEIAKLDEKVKGSKLLITDEKDVSVLLEDISDLANSSGVKISQIKPVKYSDDSHASKTKKSKFTEIVIQISARADFHQLGNFISKIESAKSFLRLSSLAIEADNKDYFVQNIKVSLTSFVNPKDRSTKEEVSK